MTVGGLVNIHFRSDQVFETYFIFVHSKKLAEQLCELYAHYWVDFWENLIWCDNIAYEQFPMGFDEWVVDFCGCRCVPVDCIQFEISEEMFD